MLVSICELTSFDHTWDLKPLDSSMPAQKATSPEQKRIIKLTDLRYILQSASIPINGSIKRDLEAGWGALALGKVGRVRCSVQ